MSLASCDVPQGTDAKEEVLNRALAETAALVGQGLALMNAAGTPDAQGAPCCDKIDTLVQRAEGINLGLGRLLEILGKI